MQTYNTFYKNTKYKHTILFIKIEKKYLIYYNFYKFCDYNEDFVH